MNLKERIRAFYEANPDEELTADDMAIKWDVSRRTLERTISELRDDGLLLAVNRRPSGAWPCLHYSAAPSAGKGGAA